MELFIGSHDRSVTYSLGPTAVQGTPRITISDEEWADYCRVKDEYEAWQDKLEAAYYAALSSRSLA